MWKYTHTNGTNLCMRLKIEFLRVEDEIIDISGGTNQFPNNVCF